jgi:hypothetical protein
MSSRTRLGGRCLGPERAPTSSAPGLAPLSYPPNRSSTHQRGTLMCHSPWGAGSAPRRRTGSTDPAPITALPNGLPFETTSGAPAWPMHHDPYYAEAF